MKASIETLQAEIRRCTKCIDDPVGKPLPHTPRPVVVLSDTAKIRIIGQAPGTRVHRSGKPFTDPSGDRLRSWMNVSEEVFYDRSRIAITPMGFCFPGLDSKGGDLPPRKECEDLWHDRIDENLPQVELTLLVGLYAQKRVLGTQFGKSLTETVRNWREVLESSNKPLRYPLPHPSWRNNSWIKKNQWFETELLPHLQRQIQNVLG